MSPIGPADKDFLTKITAVIEDNLSNEQFGVSELADAVGMSRSNLLRKIRKSAGQSASQFIRSIRLKHAMDLLMDGKYNVSEVGYKVGFNSTSYFIKCFHEQFGYPPGEAATKETPHSDINAIKEETRTVQRKGNLVWMVLGIVLTTAVIMITINHFLFQQQTDDKSIGVLPFKNDSGDTSNIYLVNGLMEAVLNNLQKIEDLRVISRTSVEAYRNTSKTIPEIAGELDVRYIVEGSGQKINDRIMLNIQLIEATTDKHLWAEQYERNIDDIFSLQNEIAANIARQVEAIITPEESERIRKIPTNNLNAYDHFLKGLDLYYQFDASVIDEAIGHFEAAIEDDPEFARAYAAIAIGYYYKDAGQARKQFSDSINHYADQALLHDAKLPQSLIAKALFYMNSSAYDLAVPYFEKALEYNPNSALAVGFLSDLYVNYLPDTRKYLEYALMGISLGANTSDSMATSFNYLHLANAFIQSGFVEEAKTYINRSLDYMPGNIYSAYVKSYINYAKDPNLKVLNKSLLSTLQKDTTRLDVLQEVAKSFYFMRDFEQAYRYYKPFTEVIEIYGLDIYHAENAKIAVVLDKLGMEEESAKYFDKYKVYADQDLSIYKHLSLAAYYAYHDKPDLAIEHLSLFVEQDNYHYWIVLFTELDPLMNNIKENPEFIRLMDGIKKKFWDQHNKTRFTLERENLI